MAMKNKKFLGFKARVEKVESGRSDPHEVTQLLQDLVDPCKGSSQYRKLRNRVHKAQSRNTKKATRSRARKPLTDLHAAAPRGMVASPPLTGGTHTVSGGLPGTRR